MTRSTKRPLRTALMLACLSASACTGMAVTPYSPPPVHAAAPAKIAATPATAGNSKGDPDQRFNAALKLMKDHQPQDAQAAFAALARDYPEYSGPLTDLAILDAQSRQRGPAIAGLGKAVAANPRNAVAWNWLGSLYRENGDYRRAEQAYRQALSVQPDYAAAHLNIGILYDVYLKRPQDALLQYREYLRSAGKEDLLVSAWIRELETSAGTTVASGASP